MTSFTFRWGVLPFKRLMGIDVPLDGVAFSRLDWLSWVAFSLELLERGRTFSNFWRKTVLQILLVRKRTRMFVLLVKSKELFIQYKVHT